MGATAAIDTPERPGLINNLPVAAATVIYAGTLVAINAAGNALPASDTAALRVVGRAEQTVDNSAGGAGDLTVDVKRGIFLYKNSAGQPIVAATKGKVAYVEDDTIVALTSTNKIAAGRVLGLEGDGVWIDTRFPALPAAVVTTVGAALAAISGGESPTEAEHNAAVTRFNELRADVLAIAALLNG